MLLVEFPMLLSTVELTNDPVCELVDHTALLVNQVVGRHKEYNLNLNN